VCNQGLAWFWNISFFYLSNLFISSACCLTSFLKSSLVISRFSSLILDSSSLASVDVFYSRSNSFWSRSSFLNCLFSLSRTVFLCINSNSVKADFKFILFNQVRFSSLGWTQAGITSETSLSDKHKGVFTSVLLTATSCKLLTTPFNQSLRLFWAKCWASRDDLWSSDKRNSTLSLNLLHFFS